MSENEKPNVINALKRLERAGSEESRATAKLREAAGAIADHIAELIPDAEGIVLPYGYVVEGYNDSGTYLRYLRDAYANTTGATRDDSLQFARDIADGWLDALGSWLEQRSSESAEAVAVLQRAAEAMR